MTPIARGPLSWDRRRPTPPPVGPLCELRLAPDVIHPELARIENDVAGWARDSGLPVVGLLDQGMPRLAARTLPHLPREQVASLVRWHLILFCVDDRCDELAAGSDELFRLAEWMRAALEDEADVVDDPLVRAVEAEWRVASDGMSPWWRARFRQNFYRHGQALAWERLQRERRVTPTRTGYADLRTWSNSRFLWDLHEPMHGVELPPRFAESLAWELFVQSSSDVLAWRNDIGSARRELAGGGAENLVVIEMRDGRSFADALRTVEDRITERCAEFLMYRDVILASAQSRPDGERSAITTVVECVSASIAGHLRWLRESQRYDFDDVATG